jgi:hypothetical protein
LSKTLSKTINFVAGNVPTRCYETNPGWMLLSYLWLKQFQTSQWLDLSLWF